MIRSGELVDIAASKTLARSPPLRSIAFVEEIVRLSRPKRINILIASCNSSFGDKYRKLSKGELSLSGNDCD